MVYLGLQGATRERSHINQAPGEWTGAIVIAIEGFGLFVTVSQKKWYIVKGIMESIMGYLSKADDRPDIDLKYLKQKVGFLVHLSMAYHLITPFLKLLYLTRDKNWWKMSKGAYKSFLKY